MYEDLSDEAMVAGIVRGEDAMFHALAERHAESLMGFFFRRTGDVHLAEDLLQETLVSVYRKASTFRGEGRFRSWLYAVAMNLLRSRSRKMKIIPWEKAKIIWKEEGAAPDGEVANGRPGPASQAETREIGEKIREAVWALPARQREVFLLRQYQGLDFEEISIAMDLTAGAARAHMHRALEALRRKLAFLDLRS